MILLTGYLNYKIRQYTVFQCTCFPGCLCCSLKIASNLLLHVGNDVHFLTGPKAGLHLLNKVYP